MTVKIRNVFQYNFLYLLTFAIYKYNSYYIYITNKKDETCLYDDSRFCDRL